MKKVRVALLALGALVMSLFVFVIPTSARTNINWENCIAGFTKISKIDKDTKPGYTGALQVYLVNYGGSCASSIGQMNGVDGYFGNGTENAVITYQRAKNLDDDPTVTLGVAGEATWRKIGSTLEENPNVSSPIKLVYDKINLTPVYECTTTLPYTFKYIKFIEGTAITSDVFHRSYG